ncbi:MAE_28990/MAE_18760 family HEPN-like nuclease [Pseudomonas aeruginosa]|nr:MAE_28990/MAE_18760 family HEPN-like nuclease [Pseudomonas aeruginosa]MCS9497609.1 MAE_28990/MAE_18760 family HEPN-like nuclease [Pseudomonas aeruginosa]MCS9603457.1 MAE_28990/MAE_18760 family HEPN-like nuclease [Pseudomonas aeruginosa]MCT1296439.1 MAE_28990/MAE_18760 family HEPN-like nuclease [Pseudomonas aeruginosa]
MSFDQAIERDLKWREAELASLKRLAITAPEGSVSRKSILRAMWAILYAHYEGFTKFCWDTVFDHIQAEGIPKGALSENFSLIAMERDFKELRGRMDAASLLRFFNGELAAILSEKAEFPEDFRLKTESNLWPNVFERESSRIGLVCSELDNHRARIKTLVGRRNEIAHGNGIVINTLNEYNEYEAAAVCLMHDLALKAIELLDERRYLAER